MTNVNTTDLNKAISIVHFSIYGVEGFKTVCVKGANVSKRVRSALNNIARCVRSATAVQTALETFYKMEKTTPAGRARNVLNKILESPTLENVFDCINVTDSVTDVLTTEEFFNSTDDIYKKNFMLFIKSIDDLEKKQLETEPAKLSNNKLKEGTLSFPRLFECTKSIFGDKPFYIILSPEAIERLVPNGDGDLACRAMCLRSIQAIKSFQLSDYLRLTTEVARNKIKENIHFLDKCIDGIYQNVEDFSELQVKDLGDLFSKTSRYRALSNKLKPDNQIFKSANTFIFEAQERITDHVMSMISPRHDGLSNPSE